MGNAPDDRRSAIYDHLHHGQLAEQEEANRYSAELILSKVFGHFRPESVLDVGCGLGTWLAAAQRLGARDVLGIEGAWLDKRLARIPEQCIVEVDLEQGFDVGRSFDLVICLEVAEHLQPESAPRLVESLVRHSDVVLFSAAIPFQGGHHHVNEQFPDYWAGLFQRYQFRVVDFVRPLVWNDRAVLWWLRQNILLFAHQELTTGDGPFAALAEGNGPLSVVHPEVYMSRLRSALSTVEEFNNLVALLASGKPVSIVRLPDGKVSVTAKA